MKRITTAEELFKDTYPLNYEGNTIHPSRVVELMKEFAKLHVKTALQAAADSSFKGTVYHRQILNAYPLDNIK